MQVGELYQENTPEFSQISQVSGEQPQKPVVSAKSGHLFEKRLIDKYITENGKDPISGDQLSSDDLIELKSGASFAL